MCVGFKPLHCPPNGVAALRELLINPAIGGFDPAHVTALTNPNVSEMQSAIGELFSKCSHRDLVLLYFTGHGVTDERGDFFFTTRETLKFANGTLNRGTTVAAGFVRNEMSNCPSRRQVAILDCCFSGAFPDGVLAMDDQTIAIEQKLGGEGRAVLTAATSTQYALEQDGEELSVYTRYLVEGLKTGAAVPNDEDRIRVGDLHDYIRDKLHTAAAAMSPQIYAAREGRDIVLAKAVVNNELLFRKSVQQYLRTDGQVSPTGQRILNWQAQTWNISTDKARAIIWEVSQPFRERHENLKEYEEAYQEAIALEDSLSAQTTKELRDYQHLLNLRDEDIAPIIERHPPTKITAPVKPGLDEKRSQPTQDSQQNLPLESEKGIDYAKLRDLLKAGKWKEADYETYLRMLEVVGREKSDYIRSEELETFPGKDLKTIDHLWVTYSKGHFGFSVQKKIWQDCGSPTSLGKDWDPFCIRVGWQNKDATAYGSEYSDFKFDPKNSPQGELPLFWGGGGVCRVGGGGWFGVSLLSRKDL